MELHYRFGYESEWLAQAFRLFNEAGLKRSDMEQVGKGLENSTYVVSCWAGEELVGVARMLTDGVMYASIFDVAVSPSHQKRGIGKGLMTRLMSFVPDARIFLTSTFGNEEFYAALGFKRHKTAMALYPASYHPNPYLEYE